MHQLSPDGMLVNDAFCDEDIKNPTAMCFNNDFTELYVADDSTESIFVFDCRYKIWYSVIPLVLSHSRQRPSFFTDQISDVLR
jgi:hypothetical protein